MKLEELKMRYQKALTYPRRRRNEELVAIMNELEQEYSVFIINPTEADLKHAAVRFYQEVSQARVFE